MNHSLDSRVAQSVRHTFKKGILTLYTCFGLLFGYPLSSFAQISLLETSNTPSDRIAGMPADLTSVYSAEFIDFEVVVSAASSFVTPSHRLTWATANIENNKGFQVERLATGNHWEILGFVAAKGKSASYDFLDMVSPSGAVDYRLRQLDNDGSETFSKIITVVQTGSGKGLKVYPTLVSNGILSIDTDGTSGTPSARGEGVQLPDYSITNLLGQQVLTGKTTQQLDVSRLSQGTYVLKVGTEVAKFVKQ